MPKKIQELVGPRVAYLNSLDERARVLEVISSVVSPRLRDARSQEVNPYEPHWAAPRVGDLVKVGYRWGWRVNEETVQLVGTETFVDFKPVVSVALRGIPAWKILPPHQWDFYIKARKVFGRRRMWTGVLLDVVWPDRKSSTATLGLGPSLVHHPATGQHERQAIRPVRFEMTHTRRTTQGTIAREVDRHMLPPSRDAWSDRLAPAAPERPHVLDLPVLPLTTSDQ